MLRNRAGIVHERALKMNAGLLVKAVAGLVLVSFGASRAPYGTASGPIIGLAGCGVCLMFVLSLRGLSATKIQRATRAGLAVFGVLIQLAGTLALATAVGNACNARSHATVYTGAPEVVMAAVCAVVAPTLLTFRGHTWMGWSWGKLGLLWGYWLAFYLLTAIVTVLGNDR